MGVKKWSEIKKLSKATPAGRAQARVELAGEIEAAERSALSGRHRDADYSVRLGGVEATKLGSARSESVVPYDIGVEWEPNTEHGEFHGSEGGSALLMLDAHPDDSDERQVLISWSGVRSFRMGSPNDEARSGHRLWDKGLRDIHWAGEVQNSALIEECRSINSVHLRHDPSTITSLRHWIVLLKGSVVEVVATDISAKRA